MPPITRRQALSVLTAGTAAAFTVLRASGQSSPATPYAAPAASDGSPAYVYLTWQGDPTTTLTVNFQVLAPDSGPAGHVRYWPDACELPLPEFDPAAPCVTVVSHAHQIPGLPDQRWIHHAELTGLAPGATYAFQARTASGAWSAPARFRTVPADSTSLRFAVGGDIGPGPRVGKEFFETEPLLRAIASSDPMFLLIGGDLAYENGDLNAVAKWDSLLTSWREHFVASGRRLIPLVLAIGNHEVQGGYKGNPSKAPFYYGFFAQSGSVAHFVRRFGPRFALVVLDSGHTCEHADQVAWLDEQLTALHHVPHKMAIYHIPLFPSVRSFTDKLSAEGRKQWLPLFDHHRVEVCFENHEHTYKRTKPLRAGQPAADGTLYLGDGSLGIGARALPTDADRHYLVQSASITHCWLVEENGPALVYRAINAAGVTFDIFPESHPDYPAAQAAFCQVATRSNAASRRREQEEAAKGQS